MRLVDTRRNHPKDFRGSFGETGKSVICLCSSAKLTQVFV